MNSEQNVITGAQLIEGMRLGERQTEGPLALFPLFMNGNGGRLGRSKTPDGGGAGESGTGRPTQPPYYITLRQALAEGRAQITEVSEGGSVPELRVVNKSDTRILLLDGEELRGAKQNRVLNTTILVDKFSTREVPESCTERGRWAYASRESAESDYIAERRVRSVMRSSVHEALVCGMPVRADQGAVWDEVDALHGRQGTMSRTSAMRDSYESKKIDLDRLVAAFPLQEEQKGLLVLHGSRVVGFDVVSRAPQYAELHDKLLRSYVFEALVSGGEPGGRDVADAFLERVASLPGRRYKSPGLGWDVRFEDHGVIGSALAWRGHVLHAAFFNVGGPSGMVDRSPQPQHRPDWRMAHARERARRRQVR